MATYIYGIVISIFVIGLVWLLTTDRYILNISIPMKLVRLLALLVPVIAGIIIWMIQ